MNGDEGGGGGVGGGISIPRRRERKLQYQVQKLGEKVFEFEVDVVDLVAS
jgi:hypothetical protein